MENKLLIISLIINILLIIVLIILLIRLNYVQKASDNIMSNNLTSDSKLESNDQGSNQPLSSSKTFKKLSFLANQTDDLIKKDTSIIEYSLPAPKIDGDFSVEKALFKRRSKRGYKQISLLPGELSQILWAAYGVNYPLNQQGGGMKTCPSARSSYPLKIYILAGNVKGLPRGMYEYNPAGHKLIGLMKNDRKKEVYEAADNLIMIKEAPIVLVFTGNPEGEEEIIERWTLMEVGHSAQNVYLQATALNLGACVIGWFDENKVREILKIPEDEQILYLMPVGHPIKN